MVWSSNPAIFDLRRQHYDSPTRNQWHPLWHLGFRLIHRIRLPEHLSYISRRRKADSSDSVTPRFLQLLRPGAVMCKMPCAVLEFEIPLKLKGLNEVLVLVVFLFHFWFSDSFGEQKEGKVPGMVDPKFCCTFLPPNTWLLSRLDMAAMLPWQVFWWFFRIESFNVFGSWLHPMPCFPHATSPLPARH